MAFRCSKCIEECMNIESPRKILFDTESESEDKIIDVRINLIQMMMMIQMLLIFIKTVKKLKKQYLMIPIIQHQITMKIKGMKKKTTL